MNAALYLRYSSDKQTELSIAAQKRACESFCADKGYSVVASYVDEAESAKTDNRPAFQKMIDDSKHGQFSVLVVHKIDRFARNRYDASHYKRQLIKAGVKLEYVEHHLDNSPESIILESVLEGMAEYYSKNLARETLKGLCENAHNAIFNGGVPPLGFDVVDRKYVINEKEAAAVRLIFSLYLQGLGYQKKKGKPFGKNSLHEILKNERYIGTNVFNRVKRSPEGKRNTHATSDEIVKVEDALPAIIEKKDFARVQEKMSHNRKRSAAYTAKRDYLLSGLIKCKCGCTMIGKTTVKEGKEYSWYYCGAQNRTSGKCDIKKVRCDKLDAAITSILKETLFNKKNIPIIQKEINSMIAKASMEFSREIAAEEDSKKVISQKLNNLLDLAENGVNSQNLKERIENYTAELSAIDMRIARAHQIAKSQLLTSKQVEEIMVDFRNEIKEKSPDKLRAVIESFVKDATWDGEQLSYYLKVSSWMVPGTRTVT